MAAFCISMAIMSFLAVIGSAIKLSENNDKDFYNLITWLIVLIWDIILLTNHYSKG